MKVNRYIIFALSLFAWREKLWYSHRESTYYRTYMKQFLRKYILLLLTLLLIGAPTISHAVDNDAPVYTTLRTIDLGTFNEFRYRMTQKFFDLREYFEVNGQMDIPTLQEMAILADTGFNYLPDDLKNENYLKEFLIDVQRAVKSPGNEIAYNEMIQSLAAFLEEAEISSIDGTIEASPESGNAPLTVTLRAKALDPTGTQIKSWNYTWWVDDGGERVILGRGTSLNYTFRDEGQFSVFLDVTSSHKNEEGYTDVLPLRERVDIRVNEKIASVLLKVNGQTIGDSGAIKFTPEDANYGLIFDATSSIPTSGTQFSRTTWDFWNGITKSYSGRPNIERVRFGTQWDYTVTMTLETNEWKSISKTFNVYVHDPIATIDVNKLDGFIGDKFTFSAKSSGTYRDLTYSWEILDIESDEILLSKQDKVFTYAFTRKWRYNVKLRVRRASGEIDEDTRIVYVTSQSPIAEYTATKPFPHKPNRVLLDASRSYDPDITDDGNLVYDWYINGTKVNLEDANSNGSVGYYVFDSIGTQSVNLEVTDPDGITSIKKWDVKIDSILSVEMFAFPRVIQREWFIKFVAESPEAEVYEWDFWDGNKRGWSLDKVTHTYEQSGTFDVKLTVSDENNNKNTFSQTVYVSESDSPLSFVNVSHGTSEKPTFDAEACWWVWAYIVDRITTYKFDGTESINIDGTTTKLEYSWKIENSKFSTASTVSHRFDEIGCFPVKLTVKSNNNGKTHSSEVLVDVRNVKPVLTSLKVDIDNDQADPIVARITAQGAEDPDGVIQSYLWYYYTDVDSEPQDFRSSTSPSTAFVIPKVTGTYYFVAILKDNNEARATSEDITGAKYFTTITGDNINTPIVDLSVNDSSVIVGEEITFVATAENILGENIEKDAVFSWDFDGDGFYDTQTNEAKTTYSYKKSWEFYAKVKVKYRGISSTKNVTMNVSNKLVADFEYFSIGNKFIFFDTSGGQIESRSWDLWDGTVKSGTYFEHTYTDKLPTHKVTLKIAEGTKIEETTKTVQKNIRNILEVNKGPLVVFTSPLASEDNTITLTDVEDKVFIYLGESSDDTAVYAIDYDRELDSDLNGGVDDDENNVGTASYNNGDVIELPLTSFRTQKIRIFTKDADGVLIASKDYTIIKEYIEDSIIDPSTIIFDGATDSEKEKIELLKTIIWELPQQQKLVGMNYINFIFDLGLEVSDEEEIITILESLLVEGQEDQSAKEITYQALKNLIPVGIECEVESGTCYDNLLSKLSDIKWSDDVEYNKTIGSEILATIATVDPELMTNTQKLDFKAILTSLVYGGDVNEIPEEEKQEVIDETPGWDAPSESDGWSGWLKIIFYVLLGIILIGIIGVAIVYVLYLLKGKKWSESFRDFADKQWEDDILADAPQDVLWDTESTDIFSGPADVDPLAAPVEEPKVKTVAPEKSKATNTVKAAESNSNTQKTDEVPAWLKGNFSEDTKKEIPKKEDASKTPKKSEVKKEVSKTPETFGQSGKITTSETSTKVGETKKEVSPVSKVEDSPKAETLDSKPASDDNVPDWLKGSFESDTSKDKKETIAKTDTKDKSAAKTEKKTEKKADKKVNSKAPKKTTETAKKSLISEKNKTEDTNFDLEWETALPDTDANVPDWLKGSFDADTSSKKDVAEVKTDEKETPKKKPAAKTSTKKVEKKPESTPPSDTKKEDKKEELWDDGMKIPDWLKWTDDK